MFWHGTHPLWFESPWPRSLVHPCFLALVSEHNIDDLIAMIKPTWIMHGVPPGLPAGEAGSRRLFATFGRSKQQWTVEDVTWRNADDLGRLRQLGARIEAGHLDG